ncbi:PLP-dependent aminotransferase family protein [Pedobacter foliorum]|uniref:aminotransferase-like domain-containing protein n=1 Tax=Pedobacter foliorum TaxID=2739058 RepID=UPI00156633E6|nr:PLP-dependent aminotransferase family protein [Pedobacter foliorum]NRF41242.1 PLP-dependent aminotransferase family protein [Pedobacter foliorum]
MKSSYPFNWQIPQLDKKRCSRQIEDFIIANIQSKNLRSGDILPAYRTLAEINDVSLNTVRRAYSRLVGSRWIHTIGGSGTFVSDRSAEPKSYMDRTLSDEFSGGLNFTLKEPDQKQKSLPSFTFVGTDFPNPSLFPEDKFFRYCNKHRIGTAKISQSEFLKAYAGKYLKDVVIDDLNKHRGFGVNADLVRIFNGREESLKRVFNVIVCPGELVINTAIYDPLIDLVLQDIGATALDLKSSDPGFLIRLEEIFIEREVKAVYIRPQCSFPESFTLNTEECNRLIALAKKYNVCIVEEDDDHEFWLGSVPYKALTCYDHDGFVIYLGALSKARPNMQSLRIVVASSYLIKMMDSFFVPTVDNRDIIEEKGIADMISNGDLEDYRRNVRLLARKNRDALDMILQNYLGEYISYVVPEHGLTFWLHFDDRFDLNPILSRMKELGLPIPFHPKNKFSSAKLNDMLLGFGAFDIREAESGGKLLSKLLKEHDRESKK